MPCLGWTNWFLWLLPVIFIIISGVGVASDRQRKGMAIAGLVMSIIALLIILTRGLIAIFLAGA